MPTSWLGQLVGSWCHLIRKEYGVGVDLRNRREKWWAFKLLLWNVHGRFKRIPPRSSCILGLKSQQRIQAFKENKEIKKNYVNSWLKILQWSGRKNWKIGCSVCKRIAFFFFFAKTKPNQKMNDRVSFMSHSKKLRGKWLPSLVQMFNDVSTNVSEVLLS